MICSWGSEGFGRGSEVFVGLDAFIGCSVVCNWGSKVYIRGSEVFEVFMLSEVFWGFFVASSVL